MIAASTPAVVLIETDSTRTGFVRRDVLVTNAHVVKGVTTVVRLVDGKADRRGSSPSPRT
jgi:predicted ABC-class ATPase